MQKVIFIEIKSKHDKNSMRKKKILTQPDRTWSTEIKLENILESTFNIEENKDV